MKKIITTIIFSFIFTLLAVPQVDACSVGPDYPPTGEENYDRSEVVFVGTVLDVDRDADINGYIYFTFKVNEAYKGDIRDGQTIEVRAAGNSAMCGYDDISQFTQGSVWSIYARPGFENKIMTDSLSLNKKYSSVSVATAEVDSFAGIQNGGGDDIACIEIYQPVCGRVDTGIRCVTTPCPSYEDKTFGNSCKLNAAGAEFLYEGECKDASPTPQDPYTPPANCKSWYDGCNTCGRETPDGPAMCTLRACMQVEQGYCSAYFANTDTTSGSDNPYNYQDYTDYPDDYLPEGSNPYAVNSTTSGDVVTDNDTQVAGSLFDRFFNAIARFIRSLIN